jgi:glycosyltransferase involved in cell wall biosynthesis
MPPESPAPNAPALSVVIACRSGAATLEATLTGLAEQAWEEPWEILLADNGSTDGSPAIFRDFAARHPEIPMRLVDASARPGKSFALNVAIATARATALAFCDADDVPAPGWVAAMGRALAHHPIVAARIDYDKLNLGWVRQYRGQLQEVRLEPLPWLPRFVNTGGGTIGFQRHVFEAVGPFSEDYPYLEDTEFCIRAQLAGFPIVLVSEAVIHVRSRADLAGIFRQRYNWGRYEMKLVRRFRDDGVPFQGGWRYFAQRWVKLLRRNLRRGLLPRPGTMHYAARLRSGLGHLTGNLVGMIAFRTPPYGPPEAG